jgi:hypothetical protein
MKSDEVAEQLGTFRELLGDIAESGPSVQPSGYKNLRQTLLSDDRVGPLLPDFVTECRTSRDFWNYIQRAFSGSGAYAQRSRYIEAQLLPIERQFRPERDRSPGERSAEIRFEYSPVPPPSASGSTLIAESRIAELRTARSAQFDLRRLIRLCEELNTAYGQGCYFATIVLTRSLLDHVPPLFAKHNFMEVANNYPGAGKSSFKEAMLSLESAARKIADAHLHTPIRKHETLPVSQQVNFGPQLDVLLAEVVRITA